MKPFSFWYGTLVALLLSVLGALGFWFFVPLLGAIVSTKLIIWGLCCLYLFWLVKVSDVRVGQITGFVAFALISVALFLFNPSSMAWLCSCVGIIWITRSLCCYRSLWQAGADVLLNGLAMLLALATALHTQSMGLTVWSFFLIQALFVGIARRQRSNAVVAEPHSSRFEQSYQTAESALSRMAGKQ